MASPTQLSNAKRINKNSKFLHADSLDNDKTKLMPSFGLSVFVTQIHIVDFLQSKFIIMYIAVHPLICTVHCMERQ